MRAIEYSETGSADVLRLVDRTPATPAPDEVLVKIAISAVNPTDWKARQGAVSGTRLEQPQVPNQDGAGVVAAIGSAIASLAVGDRVWVWDAADKRPDGTAQEVALLPERQVVRLADAVSFEVGAALGIPALTAHLALTAGDGDGGATELAPGALREKVVLIAGGAGAVGHAAIQLATWAGATVITTVSSQEKGALALSAGAHHVLDYTRENIADRVREIAPAGVDVIVEVNPVANLRLDVDVIRTGGTISIYAASGSDEPAVPVRAAMTKNVRLQFLLTYTTSAERKDAAVRAVSAAAAAGALEVGAAHGLPLERFPLEETARAHRAVENGFVGKVLIDVAELEPRVG